MQRESNRKPVIHKVYENFRFITLWTFMGMNISSCT